MGIPVIPCVNKEQAYTNILESIALEETALAHIINAEGEKIQASVAMLYNGTMNATEVIDFQVNVSNVMKTLIKMQMLLQFKLEETVNAICNECPDHDHNQGHCKKR